MGIRTDASLKYKPPLCGENRSLGFENGALQYRILSYRILSYPV
jgi:hypothetical protein